MDLDLRKSQICQLDILLEIDRICKKNNIQYFLSAGTLLGAVRHKGFIPWDDDLDIGMTRDNYDKFLIIANRELDNKFFLQNWDTDNKFALPFSKIQLLNTIYLEKNAKNVDIHHGIFVDIFPYDNILGGKQYDKKQIFIIGIFKNLLLLKSGYDYIEKFSFKMKILRILSCFFSYESLHRKFNKTMRKYNEKDTSKVVTFGGASSIDKETLEYEWINEQVLCEFEGYLFPIPKEWDKYLTHFYGDYMTPPPIELRENRHGILARDFGDFDFSGYKNLLK